MTPVQTLLFILGCCGIGVATTYLIMPAIIYICVAIVKAKERPQEPNKEPSHDE